MPTASIDAARIASSPEGIYNALRQLKRGFRSMPSGVSERVSRLHLPRPELKDHFAAVLRQTDEWLSLVRALQTATEPRLRHAFRIRGWQDEGKSIEVTVNPQHWAGAHFAVGEAPPRDAAKTVENPEFGYFIHDEYRRIGTLASVSLDASGKVIHVSAKHGAVLTALGHHLFGRTLTSNERARVVEINEKLIAYLRSHSESKTRLDDFVAKRKWPEGIADKAELAYFHEAVTPLRAWAETNGFSAEEMFLAGWYNQNFDNVGRVCYSSNGSHVIRIPYRDPEGQLTVWRSRNLKESEALVRKYLSWPLDRSVDRTMSVAERLYNGARLHEARDKDLIITEGEFKCLVSWCMTGIPTVGIPGITEVDNSILQAIIEADPRRVVVILDRDCRGKGLLRIDGISDSERASFVIAEDLRALGYKKEILIGRLPDVFDGEKVGLDDYLLAKGADAIQSVLRSAIAPQLYAKRIGFERTFFELLRRRQQINKALENYCNSAMRGGEELPQETLVRAVAVADQLNVEFRQYLNEYFHGARRITQPYWKLSSLYTANEIPGAERKIIVDEQGRRIDLGRFCQDIVCLDLVPAEVPQDFGFVLHNFQQLPVRLAELRIAHEQGRYGRQVRETLKKGCAVYGLEFNPQELSNGSFSDFAYLYASGYLQSDFPADEYEYRRGLNVCALRGDYWEQVVSIPLTILKKGSNAVGVVSMPLWQPYADESEISRACMASKRTFSGLTFMLRDFDQEHQRDKLEMVFDTIFPEYFSRRKIATVASAEAFGVTKETVQRENLILMDPDSWAELRNHLVHKRLLNQATQSGLFIWDKQGNAVTRFNDFVLLMPVRNMQGSIVSLRVFPLGEEDRKPPALPLVPKVAYPLYGAARNYHRNFDPDAHLYLHHNLATVKGKPLVVAHHELDALVLSGRVPHVVGLSSSLNLSDSILREIHAAGPSKIQLVLDPFGESNYDAFGFDGVRGHLKEAYNIAVRLNSVEILDGTPRSWIPVEVIHPVVSLSKVGGLDPQRLESYIAQLLEQGVDVYSYLEGHQNFNSALHKDVRRVVDMVGRIIDYVEIPVLRDPLDTRPIDWWVRTIKRLYSSIEKYAEQTHQVKIPTLEEYLQKRLKLDGPKSLEAIIADRAERPQSQKLVRPLYFPSRAETAPLDDARAREVAAVINQHFSLVDVRLEEIGQNLNQISLQASSNQLRSLGVPQMPTPSERGLNPVGVILEMHQKMPTLVPRPVDRCEQTVTGFEWKVTLEVNDQILEGAAEASTKKAAKSLAYDQLLSKVNPIAASLKVLVQAAAPTANQSEDVPAVSTREITIVNPVGALLELHQQRPGVVAAPTFQFEDQGARFRCRAEIEVLGQTYLAEATASTKQSAKALAAEGLYLEVRKGGAEQSGIATEDPVNLQRDPDPAPVIENPVGAVIELLTRYPNASGVPVARFAEMGGKFVAEVETRVGETEYSGRAEAWTKKRAKALAYDALHARLIAALPSGVEHAVTNVEFVESALLFSDPVSPFYAAHQADPRSVARPSISFQSFPGFFRCYVKVDVGGVPIEGYSDGRKKESAKKRAFDRIYAVAKERIDPIVAGLKEKMTIARGAEVSSADRVLVQKNYIGRVAQFTRDRGMRDAVSYEIDKMASGGYCGIGEITQGERELLRTELREHSSARILKHILAAELHQGLSRWEDVLMLEVANSLRKDVLDKLASTRRSPISTLNEVVQLSRLQPPRYFVVPGKDDFGEVNFKVQVVLKLPNGKAVTSSQFSASDARQGKQAAAADLLGKLGAMIHAGRFDPSDRPSVEEFKSESEITKLAGRLRRLCKLHKLDTPRMLFSDEAGGAIRACTLMLLPDGTPLEIDVTKPSRREARLDATRQMVDALAAFPVPRRVVSEVPEQSISPAEVQSGATSVRAERPVAIVNSIGALQEYCVRNKLELPTYDLYSVGGPAHEMRFCGRAYVDLSKVGRVQVDLGESEYKLKKQDAKTEIAQRLLEKLAALEVEVPRTAPAAGTQSQGAVSPASVNIVAGRNFIGIVMEFCQGEKIDPPSFAMVRAGGPDHAPLFRCSARLKLSQREVLSVESSAMSSKAEAKMMAAALLCEGLAARQLIAM